MHELDDYLDMKSTGAWRNFAFKWELPLRKFSFINLRSFNILCLCIHVSIRKVSKCSNSPGIYNKLIAGIPRLRWRGASRSINQNVSLNKISADISLSPVPEFHVERELQRIVLGLFTAPCKVPKLLPSPIQSRSIFIRVFPRITRTPKFPGHVRNRDWIVALGKLIDFDLLNRDVGRGFVDTIACPRTC